MTSIQKRDSSKSEIHQLELFPSKALPDGFVYYPNFLSSDDERGLLLQIKQVEFTEVRVGNFIAKRRSAHFGLLYEYGTRRVIEGAPPIPLFLVQLRTKISAITLIPPEEFVEVLLTEYPNGAGIGWHRDSPMFGVVVGISLNGECRMQFRRIASSNSPSNQFTTKQSPLMQILEPCSAYVLQGAVHTQWEHSIPSTEQLRYSITFRTLPT